MKRYLKIQLLIFGLGLSLFWLLGTWLVSNAPTAEDARVSESIRNNFMETARTDALAVEIVGSPKRGATQLFISGKLSKTEEQTFQTMAANLEVRTHRRIGLVFRP